MSIKHTSTQREYARLAPNYDVRWSTYVEATTRETMKRLHLKPGQRLLDVGCGTGFLLEKVISTFPDTHIAGMDPSPEMLGMARGKCLNGIDFMEGWAESLPFRDDSFDVVVSCNAFHYWRQPAMALDEIARVLKPEGRLLITDWCGDHLACRICDLYLRAFNRAHFRTYGAKECEALIATAGFHDIGVERYKISWLWGMMTVTAKGRVCR
ncbi:MAG: methyltransferase domain-containing protein [Mariprofundaceae bacterium]|nr:methyltransferase domain-containing protein [Mariprofundaceae bacterium]